MELFVMWTWQGLASNHNSRRDTVYTYAIYLRKYLMANTNQVRIHGLPVSTVLCRALESAGMKWAARPAFADASLFVTVTVAAALSATQSGHEKLRISHRTLVGRDSRVSHQYRRIPWRKTQHTYRKHNI